MNYLVKESPMISAEEAPIEAPQPVTPMPWLTGEVLLYTLIVLIAAGLRFAQLDIYPLNDAEAAQAMVGYQISNGQTPTVTSGYSPFIATLNSFAFLLFDDSDGAARLGPALLGIVLVLLPIRLRRRLGVFGSLAASALLALSASTVFWSRTASGEMAVAVGGLMIWVAAVDWFEARSRFSVFMAATGLVLLLTGAPSAFTLLTILIALIIFTAATNRAALNAFPADLVQIGLTIGQVVLFGIALLIVLGTAALFNLSGLAAISDMFTVWLNQFGFQPQPGAAYPAFLMLLFYEPLLVIFGLVAIIKAFRLGDLFEWLLIVWLGLVIIFDLLMGGRTSGQILLAVIPLALLAGQAIGDLAEQLLAQERLEIEGLFLAFGFIISTFVYVSLTSWSKCDVNQAGCSTAWVLPAAGTILLMALFAIFWGWYGAKNSWQSLGLLVLVVVGLFSIGAGWRLSYGPLQALAFQPMISQPTSTRFETLLAELTRLSAERAGDPSLIDIAVVDYGRPMLRWHLRHFTNLHFVENFNSAVGASVVLSAPDVGQPLGGSYVGQDLALISYWSPQFVAGKDWLRWYLYRFLINQVPRSDQIILWVKEG
jgi:hypothetical protein